MISCEELREKALELLDDGNTFCEMVRALDSYNGFADGFRCHPMDEIDELFYGVKIGDFLDKLESSFNHTDYYFTETIWGIGSTDNEEEFYRDNTDNKEVLDALIDCYPHIYFSDSELEEIVEALDLGAEFYDEDTLEPIVEDEDED